MLPCGDAPSDGGSDGAAQTLTVGGTVSGLTGMGPVLSDGAGHQLAVTANGTFQFAAPYVAGASVTVTISQQPMSPAQVCTVTGGTPRRSRPASPA